MLNPCYDCPKYRDYGKYLDDVLISRTPPEIAIAPATLIVKNPDDPVEIPAPSLTWKGIPKKCNDEDPIEPSLSRKTRAIKLPDAALKRCEMGGCDRDVQYRGMVYCKSCSAARAYSKKMGKPIPTELTTRQKRARGLIK